MSTWFLGEVGKSQRLPTRGRGVEKAQNSVHMVYEWPLSHCYKIGPTFVCTGKQIFRHDIKNSCLYNMKFFNDELILKTCELKTQKTTEENSDYVIPLGQNKFMVSTVSCEKYSTILRIQ